MSKILRRPMFRGGGQVSSYGKGIAAPLVPGYEGGGSINTPRRGLVSLPGGYSGEKSLSQKISEMFGSVNASTSGGIIPNNKKFSIASSDGNITGQKLIDKNVQPVDQSSIPGVYKPKDKEDSDSYTDFKLNQPDILTEEQIDEKVEKGNILDKRFLQDFGFLDFLRQDITGLTRDLGYGESDVGKQEYRDKIIDMNEKNKELYEKYKIPYEGDVSGNKVPPSMRGDNRYEEETNKLPDTTLLEVPDDGDNEEPIDIDPKEAIAKNQALFAELLGADKARGQDIGDMLLRFSGSQGNTVGEKFQNYTRAESAAGPSRSEKIKQTAAGLAINDYVAGKRSKEQADIYKGKIDYKIEKEGSQLSIAPNEDLATAKAKAAKLTGQSITSDQVIATLIQGKTGKTTVPIQRIDIDLDEVKRKKDKLKKGYNIVNGSSGQSIIVLYDGVGEPNIIGTIDQMWGMK